MTSPPLSPAYDLERIRAGIPLLTRAVPLNNCSQGPLSDVARNAAKRFMSSWDTKGMAWEEWIGEVEHARRAFATLINAAPDEVAVTSSVSHATSALATSIRFDEGRDAVVASGMEFPSVGQIWVAQERRGARVRWVEIDDGAIPLGAYDAAIDERTAVVSAAHAWFQNGVVQDVRAIARLARERGALSYVDAYQSLGAVPVDVKALEVDALASGTLKFLMGTPGIAFLYVRREVIERLEPLITGWFGRVDPFTFDARHLDWSPSAARFDSGTPPLFSAYVSRATMEWLHALGGGAIHEWTQHLARRVSDGARERGMTLHAPAAGMAEARLLDARPADAGPADARPSSAGPPDAAALGSAVARTPTTAILTPNAHAVEATMRARGFIVSARGPAVRIAPHFYNSEEDVDRALDAMAELKRS